MAETSAPPTGPGTCRDGISIGQLARTTGLSVETIRIWERRYGRPVSMRLPSGHRRYSDEQARWLRRVVEAVAHGARPSDAVAASPDELDSLLARAVPEPRPDCEEWLDLARDFDAEGLRSRLGRESEGRTAREFVDEIVAPLVTATGRAWADGRIDVRHEHFLSAVVTDSLRTLRGAATPRPDAPRVVFSTLPGERHGLGIEMASLVAACAGGRCVILGPDTPLAEIAAAAREVDASAVAVSVSVAQGGIDADRSLAELRRALPPWVRLAVGGAGTRRPRRAPRGIDYVEDFARFEEMVAQLDGRRDA